MIVLIDNYDSFVYNLYQFLAETGQEVRVARNDRRKCSPWRRTAW